MQLRRGGVEQGLFDGGISSGYAAKQQPLVQEGHHLGWVSRFVDLQVIATDERGRLKLVGDRNTGDAHRLSRQQAALNGTGFVQFLLS